MTDYNAFNPSSTITFVVKNNSSIGRSIKVFNTRIAPGASLDLMKIPGVTEEDIRSEMTKGSLKSLVSGGSLVITASTVNLHTLDTSQNLFLNSVGLPGNFDKGFDPSSLTQTTWFIDPINGLDTNAGTTSALPLKTFAALSAKWGTGNTLSPTGNAAAGGALVTVNIVNSLPLGNTDPLSFNVNLEFATQLLFQGAAPVQTPLAVTAVRTKVRSTNTPNAITPTVATPASLIGARIRDTTNGGMFWGIFDEGGGVLRVTEPMSNVANSAINAPVGTANRQTLTGTDTFVTEAMVTAQPGTIIINGSRTITQVPGSLQNRPNLIFADLFLDDFNLTDGPEVGITFQRCQFNRALIMGMTRNLSLSNCFAGNVTSAASPPGNLIAIQNGDVSVRAGGWYRQGPSFVGSSCDIDLDTICEQCSIPSVAGSWIRIGTCGIFDSTVNTFANAHKQAVGSYNVDGSGIYVAANGALQIFQQADTTSALWGSGQVGAGVNVINGTALYDNVANLTITGAAGNFKLGNQTTLAYSFNNSTFAYNPPVTCSWANLATADGYPSGLFYPPKGVGITKST